ncbi:hypothetical protein [Fodinibius salsisoli]|uniref:Uncharacterized protein n=1 Tax=Fodinibius salsisoli TaxID=2820877 RepID=A0ABT3PRV8_9BACT|nr:hypothetical protein [Fodinibius salsisoli]MCW9708566.1 hypothetical protein [Fodinibius salsisoli]
MDIFKLFFNHDQRLDKLAKRNANKTPEEVEATLADFMKPDPTYSKFYITGTRLEEEKFGLDTLNKGSHIINQLGDVFSDRTIYTSTGSFENLSKALSATDIGGVMVIASEEPTIDFETLRIDEESNIGHKKEGLSNILKSGAYVMYKEQAHDGFDLHLLSMENIYPSLFDAFQPLVEEDFRFFSINSKRMGSERHFYFETWTLDRPPHGAEEVFTETVL